MHCLYDKLLVEIHSLVWPEQNASILDYQLYLLHSLFPRIEIIMIFEYREKYRHEIWKIRKVLKISTVLRNIFPVSQRFPCRHSPKIFGNIDQNQLVINLTSQDKVSNWSNHNLGENNRLLKWILVVVLESLSIFVRQHRSNHSLYFPLQK